MTSLPVGKSQLDQFTSRLAVHRLSCTQDKFAELVQRSATSKYEYSNGEEASCGLVASNPPPSSLIDVFDPAILQGLKSHNSFLTTSGGLFRISRAVCGLVHTHTIHNPHSLVHTSTTPSFTPAELVIEATPLDGDHGSFVVLGGGPLPRGHDGGALR